MGVSLSRRLAVAHRSAPRAGYGPKIAADAVSAGTGTAVEIGRTRQKAYC